MMLCKCFRDQLKECTQRRSNSLDVKSSNRVMVVSGNVHTYGCSALSEGLAWQSRPRLTDQSRIPTLHPIRHHSNAQDSMSWRANAVPLLALLLG